MPSGKTHLRIEIGILVVVLAGAGALLFLGLLGELKEFRIWGVWFIVGYLFSSLFLSPDMDLARSDPKNRWGALKFVWCPYSFFFKHRGLSHNPLFGPLTRVVYLGFWVSLVVAGLHYGTSVEIELDFLSSWKKVLMKEWLWALGAGLVIPNEVHILADKFLKN